MGQEHALPLGKPGEVRAAARRVGNRQPQHIFNDIGLKRLPFIATATSTSRNTFTRGRRSSIARKMPRPSRIASAVTNTSPSRFTATSPIAPAKHGFDSKRRHAAFVSRAASAASDQRLINLRRGKLLQVRAFTLLKDGFDTRNIHLRFRRQMFGDVVVALRL